MNTAQPTTDARLLPHRQTLRVQHNRVYPSGDREGVLSRAVLFFPHSRQRVPVRMQILRDSAGGRTGAGNSPRPATF